MKRILLIFFFLILSTTSIQAFMFEFESGVTWVHNEAYKGSNSKDKDPDPILYRVGAAFPLYITDSFFIRPSLTIISTSWQYDATNEWALPVDPMWQDLLVMSFLLDISFGYQLNLSSFSLAFFGGPAFNLKLPLWGEGDSVREDMISYFYREARFFNLAGGLFFIVPLSDVISLTIKADTWIPVYQIWSSTDLPFSDGLMVTLSAGFRFSF